GDPEAEPIVTGEARPYCGAPPATLNLGTIKVRCHVRQVAPPDGRLDQNFMTFGPRWANIRRVDFGQSEALAELALPESFSNDLSGFHLHPAVLDMATGCAQALIPDVDLKADFFVPMGYGVIRIFGAMPAHVFSHVRYLQDSPAGLAAFDVTLTDGDGNVIAEIARFTMRRIEAGATFRSEEHTSELQSRENIVCRLLLEKKKIYKVAQ